MKGVLAAFGLGMLAMAAAIMPAPGATASDGGVPLYYDMGTIHVQFSHKTCGSQILAVEYQIEYADPAQTSFITAYRPKLESVIFAALSDHMLESQNTRAGQIKRIMKKAVDQAIGAGIASDVLVTEIQVLGQ